MDVAGLIKGGFDLKKAAPKTAKYSGVASVGIAVEANLQPILKGKGLDIPPGIITSLVTVVITNILSWWKHRKGA